MQIKTVSLQMEGGGTIDIFTIAQLSKQEQKK